MSLAERITAVARQPASLQARAELAAQLESMGVPVASGVWVATVRAAASRGQFFAALTVCRRHLRGTMSKRLLDELARRYGAERRKDGARRPPPMTPPREVDIPEERGKQVEVALQVGGDLTGVGLPDDVPMPEVPLFGQLRKDAFVALAQAMQEVPIQAGQALAVQGSVEPAMYLLAQGEVLVRQTRPDGESVDLACVAAPALIGEMSLLTAVPRRASVVSTRPGLAWRIDADTLKRLGAAHPDLVGRLGELVKRRLLGNLVRNSELVSKTPDRDALLGAFRVLQIGHGGEVFPQGADAPGLFLLLHGSAEVWVDGTTRAAVLTEGDAFGEMSLLTGEPTTAAVRTPDGAVLLHLPAEAWRAMGGRVESLAKQLEALAGVRRGELDDLVEQIEDEFEVVDASWLVE